MDGVILNTVAAGCTILPMSWEVRSLYWKIKAEKPIHKPSAETVIKPAPVPLAPMLPGMRTSLALSDMYM